MESGFLHSEIWGEGLVDPHTWYVETSPPDLVAGSYDSSTLRITATGNFFFAYRGTGDLYYRKDLGSWVAIPIYISWSSLTIIGQLLTTLDYGVYDLKIVRSDSEEDTLLNAFEVVPSTSQIYYADFDSAVAGVGTEASPWTKSQVQGYYHHDLGYHPVDGDIIRVKGSIISTDPYIFNVDIDDKTITLEAWDKEANGLYSITAQNKIFDIDSSNTYLIVKDAVIISSDTLSVFDTDICKLKNCIVMSDYNITIDADMYGCTINIDSTAILTPKDYIYDSIICIRDTAQIFSGSTVEFVHCETNVTEASLPGTKTDCTFENSSIERMPDEFITENDFNYYIYDIVNQGSGSAFWVSNDISIDIKGYARTGIGAVRFEAYSYYVDGEKVLSGDGSEADPMTMNQLRNYFDTTLGDACNVSPTGYDTFLMKNIFNPIDDFFINISEVIGGYVTIKSSDILVEKAWFLEAKNGAGTEFDIATIGISAYMMKLIVKDGILTQNTDTINDVKTIVSSGVSNYIDIELKNFMIYCKSADIDFSSDDPNIYLYGYGLTIKTPGIFRAASIQSLNDSVIKALELSDV